MDWTKEPHLILLSTLAISSVISFLESNTVTPSDDPLSVVHAQGIVHRDIKPDNLLLDANNALKIVDFGVSEMFTKDDDRLKSSSGSPAFAAPELSRAGFNNVSGKAADIWAMGVTLYALIYGVLPFDDYNVLELYDNIRTKEYDPYQYWLIRPYIPAGEDPLLMDLFHRILDKNPATRIKMSELRVSSLFSFAE